MTINVCVCGELLIVMCQAKSLSDAPFGEKQSGMDSQFLPAILSVRKPAVFHALWWFPKQTVPWKDWGSL